MRGYYRAPDLTAKAIDSRGWFNTGDLARFEAAMLYIVGRTKEMIIRSGFNVYPAEVEAVLNSHGLWCNPPWSAALSKAMRKSLPLCSSCRARG